MMKEKLLGCCMGMVAGSTVFLISSCGSVPASTGTLGSVSSATAIAGAKQFNEKLAEAILNADKIVIKEHSHKVDFFGTTAGIYNPPQYIYTTKELDEKNKMILLNKVRALSGQVKKGDTSCMFEPHHTIDFYEQGQLKSSVEISYECNDIKWDGSSLTPSQDAIVALSSAVLRAGMKTHRDWDAMAKKRYEEGLNAKRNATNSGGSVTGPPVAKWVPGMVGKKVFNPFTRSQVDVEGIPANTKVRDPNDSDPAHVFLVP